MHPCFLVELREKTVYKNVFLDHCLSAIFEFSGNEFEFGENKIERERENQLFSRYDRGPLNSVIKVWKRHNICERYYFGMRKHIEVEDGGREGGGAILRGTIFLVRLAFQKCWPH